MNSLDGHKLYPCSCIECGKDRGMQRKRQLNKKCRNCIAKSRGNEYLLSSEVRAIADQNRQKHSYSNVDKTDFVVLPCGVRKFRCECSLCGIDKGYQTLSNARDICLACYQKQNASTIPDVHKRLKKNFASNLYHRLRSHNGSKGGMSTFKIVGYTLEALKDHLEHLFEPGMSWDNYGSWHVDHKTPDSWFTYSAMEDEGFRQSWALENLQPKWALDNIRKGDRFAD